MLEQQLKRLKNDSAELEQHAISLQREGNKDLAKKIIVKKQYLESYIAEKEVSLV